MTRNAHASATALGVVAAAGVAAFAYGSLVERRRFTVRQELVPVLPPGARSITVLHLSDLHMAPWQTDKQDFVRSLIRYEPDLVVDTGDNLGHTDAIDAVEWALEPFRGIPGVFAHGSNDYLGPVFKNPLAYLVGPSRLRKPHKIPLDTPSLNRFLTGQLGWLDLNNAAHALELRGTRLELFGTGDAHQRRDDLAAMEDQVEELRENVEWSEGTAPEVVGIGVTHAPYRRILDAFVDAGAEIIFAGHTHGGQVRIPGFPAVVTNCDLPRDQAQGLSTWRTIHGGAVLEVSAGIGTSIYAPVRFAVPPEAVLLTLVPRNG